MSFETQGQKLISKVIVVATWAALYGAGVLAVVYLLDAFGPEPRNRCVCECNGKVAP
jgi:hypothetical protein